MHRKINAIHIRGADTLFRVDSIKNDKDFAKFLMLLCQL